MDIKSKAWKKFIGEFPRADKKRFFVQEEYDDDGDWQSVYGSQRKYWSDELKQALGLGDFDGFPYQLAPVGIKTGLSVPAVDFAENPPNLLGIFGGENLFYATPSAFFKAKLRNIFKETILTHTSGQESKKWLAGPNMMYWDQQLNFAGFCATQACGVSKEVFDQGLEMTPQIRAFYQFHVYFTTRRVLYQMGGIQNSSALPGDPAFNRYNNPYDKASYFRLCGEFGVEPSTDFRFIAGANKGLGDLYVYASGAGPSKTDYKYPGWKKFSDEGGKAIKGDLIYEIKPGRDAARQFDWFVPITSNGLTQAGLARINQSIEAYVYCILGSQANVMSSIIGDGGRAKEAQTDFLVLLEESISKYDPAASVQRYQLALDKAKARLNLAVAPMAWLMPANMVINTSSTAKYNNKLKQAVKGVVFGVNNSLNPDREDTKNFSVHKGTAIAQKGQRQRNIPLSKDEKGSPRTKKEVSEAGNDTGSRKATKLSFDALDHESNKTSTIIAAVAITGLIVFAIKKITR